MARISDTAGPRKVPVLFDSFQPHQPEQASNQKSKIKRQKSKIELRSCGTAGLERVVPFLIFAL
jgi:hypothetical protein